MLLEFNQLFLKHPNIFDDQQDRYFSCKREKRTKFYYYSTKIYTYITKRSKKIKNFKIRTSKIKEIKNKNKRIWNPPSHFLRNFEFG